MGRLQVQATALYTVRMSHPGNAGESRRWSEEGKETCCNPHRRWHEIRALFAQNAVGGSGGRKGSCSECPTVLDQEFAVLVHEGIYVRRQVQVLVLHPISEAIILRHRHFRDAPATAQTTRSQVAQPLHGLPTKQPLGNAGETVSYRHICIWHQIAIFMPHINFNTQTTFQSSCQLTYHRSAIQ